VSLLLRRLEDELLPHEQHEEEELLPVVARALGGPDPTGALSRTHAEIERRVTRLRRLVDEVGSGPKATEDIIELRRDLYGLYAIMHLHNAQEDEAAFSLLRDDEGTSQSAPNS
jgi:iron-sulfur cluster repair protein YtfE (RIC family)